MTTEPEEFAEHLIARQLILSEGEEPEFLSISEAVGEYWEENELDFDEEEMDEMVNDIRAMISSATITITFKEE